MGSLAHLKGNLNNVISYTCAFLAATRQGVCHQLHHVFSLMLGIEWEFCFCWVVGGIRIKVL